jgi:amidase
VHAFADDALGAHDAVGLVAALHAGEVSVPEVVEAAIARAERVQADLNALVLPTYDTARAGARNPPPGFFAGVPTATKDMVDVTGEPTMHGTDAWTPQPAPADGDFIRMFGATGLLSIGRSRLSEYGFIPATAHTRQGAVPTPWSLDHTAGGSSSGSAALVAAGVVPIAHAADGGGSIRIPAAVNGLVGLKSTRGRLAQDALTRQMPLQLVAHGVLTRSVRDTAAFFREAERIYRPLSLPPIGDLTRPGRSRLTVAVQTAALGQAASPEVRELTLRTAALLESLGHRVEEVEAPVSPRFVADFLMYWSVLAFAVVTTGRHDHGRSWNAARLDPFALGLHGHARRRLHRLPTVLARLRAARRTAERFFGDYDVHLSPTMATQTPTVGHLDPSQGFEVVLERVREWMMLAPWQNVTGQPAISLPLATTAAGLPQGMQFTAGWGREARLIELAYELETAAPFASIRG